MLEENIDEFIYCLGDIPPDPPQKRATCSRCCRPVTTCWCAYLPREPVAIRTSITILQHPYEESRRLRTAPMLQNGLSPGQCKIIKGKKFNLKKYPHIQKLVQDPNTILMFPGPEATDVSALPSGLDIHYNLLLLDGTWMQARGLFCQNPFMRQLKQVQLSSPGLSEYVIRTQPNDGSLSTLETAVYTVAMLENRPSIIQPLLSPLRAMCRFQMQHGAVKHHSKQFLIDNGLYKKQLPPDQQISAKDKTEKIHYEILNSQSHRKNGQSHSKIATCDSCQNSWEPNSVLSSCVKCASEFCDSNDVNVFLHDAVS